MLQAKILSLCQQHNLSVNAVESQLGIARSTIARMDKTMPRIDTITKLADFFGVSVDWLLDREERIDGKYVVPATALPDDVKADWGDEQVFIHAFYKLSLEEREAVKNLVKMLEDRK